MQINTSRLIDQSLRGSSYTVVTCETLQLNKSKLNMDAQQTGDYLGRHSSITDKPRTPHTDKP